MDTLGVYALEIGQKRLKPSVKGSMRWHVSTLLLGMIELRPMAGHVGYPTRLNRDNCSIMAGIR